LAREDLVSFGAIPDDFMLFMFLPHILTFLLPLFLAAILTVLMQKHRRCEYETASLRTPFASLFRRGIAQLIDASVLGGPLLIGFLMCMTPLFDLENMTGPPTTMMLTGFGLMGMGLLWVLSCLVVFSYMEGRYGATPGKWIANIRVLGTDLHPCGFWRGLVRNLLKFVDGFFSFMIGVMLVALTENWQRLGDMVARTVVVDVRKGSVPLRSSGVE
jgi:uncharacterized RDD family membrane protein YckC